MNEDLKPCYDIESCWERSAAPNPKVFIARHKECHHLFRIVDFAAQTIKFHDTLYVKPEGIIDIYRPLTNEEKGTIKGLILGIMHEIRPISMPYVPVSYKVYIEYHEKALGVLYFMDVDEDKSIVPIKRFFEIKRDPVLNFEEISWDRFREIAEEDKDEH